MAYIRKDRVWETTLTTGTGSVVGAGAVSGYRDLSTIGNGGEGHYTLVSGDGAVEFGWGTVTVSGSPATRTLSRDEVEDGSSGAGVKVSLTGTSQLFFSRNAKTVTGLWSPVLFRVPTSANTGLTTWLNQGGASVADRSTGITLSAPAGAGDNLRCRYKAAPATPYSIKALIALSGVPLVTASQFASCGIGWYDGSNKLEIITLQFDQANGLKLAVERWATVSSFSAEDFTKRFWAGNPMWMRLRDDGTTVYFQVGMSGDDDDFITLYSVAKASGYLGAAGYANILFYASRTGTTPNLPSVATMLSYGQGS